MEVFQPLVDFYEAVGEDVRITTTHISLYIALLKRWNQNGGKNPVMVIRGELMKDAKISARHTYNKIINELQEYGYIKYVPSSHPYLGSSVYMNKL